MINNGEMDTRGNVYDKQVICSDVPSKSNSYWIICIAGHYSLGKTKALKEYEQTFYLQCSLRNKNIKGFFKITLDVYFSSNRKDLDNSLKVVFDCLQGCKAIQNDRQCVEIHARKLIDKNNPRVEFVIEEVEL